MVAFGIAFGMDYIPLLILSADPPQGFLFFRSIDEGPVCCVQQTGLEWSILPPLEIAIEGKVSIRRLRKEKF